MHRQSAALGLTLAFALLSGCSRAMLFNGGLYSHTTEPLTFNRDPVQLRECENVASGEIKQLQYPMAAVLGVRVGENGIGAVAKEGGINTVYYADLERRSALFGLWSQEMVHIYGK